MGISVHCDIVSAEESLFSGMAKMVIASGHEGELGVTAGHTPLLTQLKPGPVKVIKQNGDEELFYVSGGFLEVQPDSINILADTGLRAKDINEQAAKAAKQKAEKELANQKDEFDYSHAMIELAEAAAKLRVLEQMKKKANRS